MNSDNENKEKKLDNIDDTNSDADNTIKDLNDELNDESDKTIQMGSGDETIINDGDETKMGELPDMGVLALGAKFTIISSVNNGEEFLLTSNELTGGRSDDNELHLDYPGVSRKHFRVFFENEKLFIEDLNSKYGIFINKKKIEGTKELCSGNTIQLGELTLKYKTANENEGINAILSNKKVIIPITLFLALILLILTAKLIMPGKSAQQPAKSENEQATSSLLITEEVNDMIFEAKKLFSDGEYDLAIEKLNSVLQISNNNKKAANLKKKFQDQILILSKLNRAKECINAGTFEQAKQDINDVLDLSPNNQKALNLLKKIDKLNASKESLAILQQARKEMDKGKYIKALKTVHKIKNPDFTDEIKDIEEKIEELKQTKLLKEQSFKLFKEGKLKEVEKILSETEEKSLIKLRQKVTKILTLKSQIENALKSSNPLDAKEDLNKLLKTVQESNPVYLWATEKLKLIASASEHLAISLYFESIENMVDGNLKDALTGLNTLVKDFPQTRFFYIIKDELSVQIDNLAKAMFRAGYVLEEQNPLKAKEIWHKLQNFIPEDHEYSKKIKTKLKF